MCVCVSVLHAPPAQNYSYLSITLARLLPRLPVACEGVTPSTPPTLPRLPLAYDGDAPPPSAPPTLPRFPFERGVEEV